MATKFNIDYLRFDALSMKRLLTQKLSENPNFTDQIYEGSNLAIIIDTFSHMFQTLMYYVNHGASEAILSDTQLYENINRIVKMFGYNPLGYITPIAEFNVRGFVDADGNSSKILPKFATVASSTIDSVGQVVSFSTVNNSTLYSGRDSDNFVLMHNGKWKMYERTFIAEGLPYERFILSNLISDPSKNLHVAYPHLAVFIKRGGEWKLFEPIQHGMFFNDQTFSTYQSTSKVFEPRINENRQYEIKFGDGIYGEKLLAGDEVYIAYLSSNGDQGVVGANVFNERTTLGKISIGISGLSQDTFNEIFSDVRESWATDFTSVHVVNSQASTYGQSDESVDTIRDNAPKWFKSTGRIITQNDFKYAIMSQFASNVVDVKIMNNWSIADSLYRWLFTLQKSTGKTYLSKNLASKWDFPWSDACDFNNIYILLKMRSVTNITKKYIERSLAQFKPLTSELVFIDPYTTYFVPCALSIDDVKIRGYTIYDFDPVGSNGFTENYVEVLADSKSLISPEIIKSNVVTTIQNFFSEDLQKIGNKIDINELDSLLSAIPGVARIRTVFKDSRTSSSALRSKIIPGLQFMYWTPSIVEGADMTSTGGSVQLEDFQFPALYTSSSNAISNRVKVITSDVLNALEAEY